MLCVQIASFQLNMWVCRPLCQPAHIKWSVMQVRVCIGLHIWWPWANWRVSLATICRPCGIWSAVLSVGWEQYITFPLESPVTLSPSRSPFWWAWHAKSTLQTNRTIVSTPPFLSPLHSTPKRFWDKGSPCTFSFCDVRGAPSRGSLCRANTQKRWMIAVFVSDTAIVKPPRALSRKKGGELKVYRRVTN